MCIKSFMNIEIEKEKREREWKLIEKAGILHNISGCSVCRPIKSDGIRLGREWKKPQRSTRH